MDEQKAKGLLLGQLHDYMVDDRLEWTMGGRRRKLARGELFLPAGKYGYRYTRIDRANHTPGHVAIDEAEAAVVQRIFERRALGVSFERIAAELTADGIASPKDKPRWMYTSVRRITRDPAYKGEGWWGAQQVVRHERSGKRTYRPRSDGRPPIRLAFPPLVSPELWVAAQAAGGRACVVRAPLDRFLRHDPTPPGPPPHTYSARSRAGPRPGRLPCARPREPRHGLGRDDYWCRRRALSPGGTRSAYSGWRRI